MKKRILSFGLFLTIIVVSWTNAIPTTFSNTEMIADWERFESPRSPGTNQDFWVASGSNLVYNSNAGQALVSDFSVDGDFSFSTRIVNSGDNDRYGLVFGFTDSANHYRLSWEGGGFREINDDIGLQLIREVGGTSVSLDTLNVLWANGLEYDLTVSRTGSQISMQVVQVNNSNVIRDTTVTDTTFLNGKVGLWNDSQVTIYSNVTLDTNAVPEPSSLAMVLIGAFGLIFYKRK